MLIITALVISLVAALLYPPNNFDSMTYHMARVAHWEQHSSIDHYRTHILRQIEFPPLAEWVILQLQVLTGGDQFANSIQLFYLAASIIVASLIAGQLGGNRIQQIFTAVAVCFIPMAIIQSNTTQNDIVTSFYILCFVYMTLNLFRKFTWNGILFAGVALGLASLTKGTAYLFTLVFCGWFVLMINKKMPLKRIIQRFAAYALIPLIAIGINAGHYQRNIFFSGKPLANSGEGTVIEGFEAKHILLITVKNLMNHLPVTSSLKSKVAAMAKRNGINPDDPKYNLIGMSSMIEGFSFHEDYAQNFLQVIFISLFLTVYFLRREIYNRPPDLYLLFVISLLAVTCLFCALLQWQPWSNRLQMPLFMLWSVFIGMEVGRLKKHLRLIVYLPLIAYGYTALLLSSRHPFLPLAQSAFRLPYDRFIYPDGLSELAKYLNNKPVKSIGLYIGLDSYDYPYYKLLRGKGKNERIIKHVFVHNNSTIYVDDFAPDVIISLESRVESYSIGRKIYLRTKIFKDYVVFESP